MRALDRALASRRRAVLIGHAAGLAAYEALALTGAAGDLAWAAGLQVLPVLLGLELAVGAFNAPARRLQRLAVELDTGGDLDRRRAEALGGFLGGLPARAALRSLGVWLASALLLNLFFGLTGAGFLLLTAFGVPAAALAQALLCAALIRDALRDADRESLAALVGPTQGRPSLRHRFWAPFFGCLAVVLVPLGALSLLDLPLTFPSLAVLALLGGLAALAWGLDLERAFAPTLKDWTEEAGRLGLGDFTARPRLSGVAALDRATQSLVEAASGLERRERALKVFGPGLDPAQGVALLDALDAPAAERFVAVLSVAWLGADAALGALQPSARPGVLGRFYEAVQAAVGSNQGLVLELGGGRVLAAWGALPSGPLAPAGVLDGALKAAWALRSSLAVLASQHRLRHAVPLDWSLALASGPASAGAWGAREHRRWALVGLPLDAVRNLGQKRGGPWLDAGSASALPAPYAAAGPLEALELAAGPE